MVAQALSPSALAIQLRAAALGQPINDATAARVAALYDAEAAQQQRILDVAARGRVQTLAEWTQDNFGFS